MTFTLRARVEHGRLVLDEPIDLPDGTEINLVPANDDDDLDAADRERLHRALRRSAEQFAARKAISAAEVLRGLRAT